MANCPAETRRKSRTLINSRGIPWRQWPQTQEAGIYIIKQGRWVIYVGRTGNLNQRPRAHCYGEQAIDIHIADTADSRLSYNYVVDPDQRRNERCYIHHITELQGRRPRFNIKEGDACAQCERR
ncbi:uncharacterized protein LOC124280684 [Haliotis rubra]|uniref:uncharacterized protein LOC124280684 n=1 Tax=Haliotis rubra TaxID=36100 RepID=UPI001EE634E4|nr:uncharacterized protein LOC124280684 [Haliotis rubra]